MGRLNRQDAAVCNPEAVVFTMLLRVILGVASAAALATGAHLVAALAHPQVAAPSLMVELMLSTFGGLVFSLAAVVGASLALWIIDHRLQRPRVVQGVIAGIGAVLPGLGLFAFLGQTATVGFGGAASILAFVAVASFTLMYIRSNAHTSSGPRPHRPFARASGIKI
ncbi:hypothetical protein E3O47_14210 [Cryobacterium sp. TMT2-17-1]|uniref:hypothetical protein n=1 Tax=unclassified Cryobacterium TaxID=2649013 RepID=UPI00106B5259|nr:MULTISPECIES: hypothetical protein [unclassified Cryobacterium]TFB59978.1 hypothetical protein E3N94_03070 [Cryobacterium sp. Sr3]TFC39026.1 hypothetical protein E3O28_04140 [Cryobacterium sp. TMT2-14]TFC48199.1 hypothetical protein E3O47_14210 [Cryobacterium sp. TMT2-17-1]